MKRFLTILLLLIGVAYTAQSQLNIAGMVLDNPSGMPIPNQDIFIDIYIDGALISEVAVSDQQGFYEQSIMVNADQGEVMLSTTDCNNSLVTYTHGFVMEDSAFIYQDFIICADSMPECTASFNYFIESPLTVQFINSSFGGNIEFLWDFGDGQTSTEVHPLHVYDAFGSYPILLTIVDNSIGCTSNAQGFVVLDSTAGSCQAMFEYTVDPVNPYMVNFFNESTGNPTFYSWDFGDGQSSNEENAMHIYNAPGIYNVCLTVMSEDTSCWDTYCTAVFIDENTPGCQADFIYAPIGDSQVFQFTDLSEGNPVSWNWNFGDGSESSIQNPEHTFENTGVYNVCLTIEGADSSCFSTYCQEISVVNDTTSCLAQFTYSSDSSQNQNMIQFFDLSQGNIDSWFWDFGDGNHAVEQNPIHTYSSPGFYTVCLTVQGTDNCFSNICQDVVVQNDTASCIAQYAYYPDSAQNPYSLQFADLSYGNVTNWYWDFGDGTSSVDQNPVHTFADEGVYSVCLTISGPSCQSVWCEEVYVVAFNDCFNYFTYETVNNSVQFNGFHSSDIPASYTWDFGDGEFGEGQQVTHNYDVPGMYFVSLMTWDDSMCEAVSSQIVVVGDTIAYNQVYGQVFAGDFPIQVGAVMIFSLDTSGNYLPYMEITPIDSSGVYVFPYVPNGEFVIFALGMNNNGYMPTYYGDVINWEDATPIVLGEPNNPYDINLVEILPPMMSGIGSISGQINQGRVSASFLEVVNMLIYNEDSEPIGYVTVNENGGFNFNNLAMGVYYLYPELPGVEAQMMRVELTAEQPQAVVNMTFADGSILGIDDNSVNVEAGNIYPNPVTDILNIQLNVIKSSRVSIKVIGLDGRTYINTQKQLNAGSDYIHVDVNDLPKGMYILQLSVDEQSSLNRKFIK